MAMRLPYKDLEGYERRAALMRIAGASTNDIALLLETSVAEVSHIMARPHVSKFILHVSGMVADEAIEVVEAAKDVNTRIVEAAGEALDTELEIMRDLRERKDNVRALLGAASTAQDILDRAGNRAPTRSITGIVHSVNPEALARLGEVIKEMNPAAPSSSRLDEIDVTPKAEAS